MIACCARLDFIQYHALSYSLLLSRAPSSNLRYPTVCSNKLGPKLRHSVTLSSTKLEAAKLHSMSSAAASATAGKPEDADHLVKLGEDVFVLEGQNPVKHDPKHPNVSA